MSHNPVTVIKVSSQSRPQKVAGAIAGVIREHGTVPVQAIGAGAVNQMVKASIIAASYLSVDGIEIETRMSFTDVPMDGKGERTAIRFEVYRKATEREELPSG